MTNTGDAQPEPTDYAKLVGVWPILKPRPGVQVVHLVLVAISLSVLFTMGVYWLLHAPLGPVAQAPGDLVEVKVIELPSPVPQPNQTAHPAPPSAAVRDTAPTKIATRPTDQAVPLPIPDRQPTRLREVTVADLAPPPSATQFRADTSSTTSEFQHELLAHIEQYRQYPEAALPDHLHGVVQVVFAMDRTGAVLGAWVKTSSGSKVLDQEAIDTIRRAQPLPSIPQNLPDRLNIMLPVEFAAPN